MNKEKMLQEERAKQFLAFDALKGFFEIMDESVNEVEERRYLSDECLEELDHKLLSLKRGDKVIVKHYEDGHYITTEGLISLVDYEHRAIRIVKKRIKVDDIFELNII